MPKRPRSHQLEDESRVAFSDSLPNNWVFRDKSHDYGIDGEVEIFDKNDVATGQIFYVQLKATDEKNLNKALKETFKVDTFNYYSSVKIPVLVVKYCAFHKRLFARWAHSKLKKRPNNSQKSFTFYFSDHDDIDSVCPTLENDLRQFYMIRGPDIRLPISLRIEFSKELSDKDYSITNVILENENFQNLLGKKLIHLDHKLEEGQLGSVICYPDSTTIYLGGGSVSITFPALESFAGSLKEFIYEVTISVGFILERFGKSRCANEIFLGTFKHIPPSKVLDQGLDTIIFSLANALLFDECIEVIQYYISDDTFPAIRITTTLLRKKPDSSSKFSEFLIKINLVMREFLEKTLAEDSELGICFYNEANILRSLRRHTQAIKCFNKARKLEPEYEKRGYFWHELAGSLFGKMRYSLSSKCYKKAIDLEPNKSHYWCLYADASMLSGNYAEAEKWFKKYLDDVENKEPLWVLKYHCLSCTIESENKTSKQSRKISRAFKLANEAKKGDIDKINKAFDLDLLCNFAWVKFAELLHEDKKYFASLNGFLWAAICNETDLTSWANAFSLAFTEKKDSLAILIFEAAYKHNGSSFITTLASNIDKHITGDAAEGMKQFFLDLKKKIDDDPNKLPPIEFRFLEKDQSGTPKSIKL